MVATLLLLMAVTVASVTDFRWRTIYNWTTYPGIAAGLMLNALSLVGLPAEGPWSAARLGLVGWEDSVQGFAACGGIMLVGFVLLGMGGGDVKLLAMVGAFLGLQGGLEVLLWTFIAAGMLAALILIWRVGFVWLVRYLMRRIGRWMRFLPPVELTEEEQRLFRSDLFLAPSVLVAVVLWKTGVLERLIL